MFGCKNVPDNVTENWPEIYEDYDLNRGSVNKSTVSVRRFHE